MLIFCVAESEQSYHNTQQISEAGVGAGQLYGKFWYKDLLYLFHYAPERWKHIVAALSVRPVPCPGNNFKTTVGI